MANEGRAQRLLDWCSSRLGPGELVPLVPAAGGQMSNVFRYFREDTSAVIKVRSESLERIKRCLDTQRFAAKNGFPCAGPLAGAEALDAAVVVSAEEWRPDGDMLRGHDGESARRSAVLLAELMALLEVCRGKALGPPPPWMHWNPPGGGLWPPTGPIDRMDQALVPDIVRDCARRAASRLRDSAQIFIDTYEAARGRAFTEDEREIAWAASIWPALHNARGEHLFRSDPVASVAIIEQAEDRLHLAKA